MEQLRRFGVANSIEARFALRLMFALPKRVLRHRVLRFGDRITYLLSQAIGISLNL